MDMLIVSAAHGRVGEGAGNGNRLQSADMANSALPTTKPRRTLHASATCTQKRKYTHRGIEIHPIIHLRAVAEAVVALLLPQ